MAFLIGAAIIIGTAIPAYNGPRNSDKKRVEL